MAGLKNNRKYQQNILLMDLLEAKKNGFDNPFKMQKNYFLPTSSQKKQIEDRAVRQIQPSPTKKVMNLATLTALAGLMMDLGGMTFPPPRPLDLNMSNKD